MDTERYINIAICMAIAVVVLTTVAVPVMTLHGSRQDTYDNVTDYAERYGNWYALVSPMDTIALTTDPTQWGSFTINGNTYSISDYTDETYTTMPVLVCDAGYISVKQNGTSSPVWDMYLYTENIENSSPDISDYIWTGTNRVQYESSSFALDLEIRNGTLTLDWTDSGGAVSYHIVSPVRMFAYGFDPDGDYIARHNHYQYPVSWKADDVRWVSHYAPGVGYENGDAVAWNPNISDPAVDVPVKDLGGGVCQTDGAVQMTYELGGETLSANPLIEYYVVPTEVMGAKVQGVDDPTIIAMVAVIPLIIAIALVLWLGRNIFSKE